jgi:DNA-directed RNA polymerase specialized sigma24 family protein
VTFLATSIEAKAAVVTAQDLHPPSPEDGLQPYRRLCDDDSRAPGEMSEEPLTSDARTRAAHLFEAHADAINRRLAARFPGTDPQLISDAVVWAVLRVCVRFERYDPARGSLRAYLFGFARRRLAALLLAEHRRRRREQKKSIDPVTAVAPCGQSIPDELAGRELAEQVRASLRLSPEDQCLLDLWLHDEKDPSAWAAALGMADRPPEEQAKEVERARARLRQCLHRARRRFRHQGDTE